MANWYVRTDGLATNGGSSNSPTPERSGTDMSTTNASTTVTSATAAFVAGDVGKGLNIAGNFFKITSVTNSTTAVLDRNYSGTGTNRAWSIGGAWRTVGSSAQTFVVGGDTIWVGPGIYREFGVGFTNASRATYLNVTGDIDGSMTGTSGGEVVITQYTTSDVAAPYTSGATLLGATYVNFKNITFVGAGTVVNLSTNDFNVNFTNCAFFSYYPSATTAVTIANNTTTTAKNVVFDSCRIFCYYAGVSISLATVTTADYDANIIFRNTVIDLSSNGNPVAVTASGANSFKGGGTYLYNCLFKGGGALTTSVSTTYPVKVYDSIFIGSYLSAGATGQIIEDYNVFVSAISNTNVTAGTHSTSNGSRAVAFNIGQEHMYGLRGRQVYEPTAYSGLKAFGSSGLGPTTDMTGAARPSGGQSALYTVGPLERANTWTRETTVVRTGSNALSITGPGYQDFNLPVDNTFTPLTVYVRWDATYAGTKPSVQVLNGTDVGVANATATAVGSSGAWEQLSLTFTPTAKGVVTIRLVSSDTNGGGKAYADDVMVG